jgi:hypothetical protein
MNKFYTKRKTHDEKLITNFSQQGIRYVKIFSDEELLRKLIGLFR